jgi:hypothetical protein
VGFVQVFERENGPLTQSGEDADRVGSGARGFPNASDVGTEEIDREGSF